MTTLPRVIFPHNNWFMCIPVPEDKNCLNKSQCIWREMSAGNRCLRLFLCNAYFACRIQSHSTYEPLFLLISLGSAEAFLSSDDVHSYVWDQLHLTNNKTYQPNDELSFWASRKRLELAASRQVEDISHQATPSLTPRRIACVETRSFRFQGLKSTGSSCTRQRRIQK